MESFTPKNQADWRQWLEENHLEKDSIWLILHKKNSSTPNLSWSEAVDEALCFGWIDSTKKSIDEEKYRQFFSKRKPTSTWSRVNKQKVDELEAKELIAQAGWDAINIAKENGMWTFLDAIEDCIIPDDLEAAFSQQGKEFFESLSKSVQKMALYWIASAKRPETRAKRVKEVAERSHAQEIPKQYY